MTISIASQSNATESNTVDATAGTPAAPASAVEDALAAAITDAGRIGDLLDVLRTARLWLPLPADGAKAISGTAVTLPIVSYLGSDFVPAYSSAELLQQFGQLAEVTDTVQADTVRLTRCRLTRCRLTPCRTSWCGRPT